MSLDQLRESVARMEERLLPAATDDVREAYERVVPRFHEDLVEERDALLSRGAALMLIQQLLRDDI